MTRFKTQFMEDYAGTPGEENTMESMTKPSDSMTIKQLLHNHTRGLGLGTAQQQGLFTGDEVAPRFQDPTEFMQYQEEMRERVKLAQKEIDKDKQKAQEKKAEEISKKAAEKVAKEFKLPSPTPGIKTDEKDVSEA